MSEQNTLIVNGKTYTKDIRHYHSDGDLILLVGDAAFRVSKAMMAKQSTVFQDMMGFKESPASQVTVDGIPAVVLDDSAQDMVLLLDHILPPGSTTASTEPAPIEAILRLIRISEKYDAGGITQSVRKELDKLLVSDTIPKADSALPAYSNPQKLVDLINNLHTHNLPQYLPYAYYKLATCRPTAFNWTPLEALTTQDRIRIDVGRFELHRSVAKDLGELSNPNAWRCRDCDVGEPFMWLEGEFGVKVLEDPFSAIDACLDPINRRDEISCLCEDRDCWEKVKEALEGMREELFRELGGFFQVRTSTKPVRARSV